VRAVMRMNTEQAPKMSMREPTGHNNWEGCHDWGSERDTHLIVPPG